MNRGQVCAVKRQQWQARNKHALFPVSTMGRVQCSPSIDPLCVRMPLLSGDVDAHNKPVRARHFAKASERIDAVFRWTPFRRRRPNTAMELESCTAACMPCSSSSGSQSKPHALTLSFCLNNRVPFRVHIRLSGRGSEALFRCTFTST